VILRCRDQRKAQSSRLRLTVLFLGRAFKQCLSFLKRNQSLPEIGNFLFHGTQLGRRLFA